MSPILKLYDAIYAVILFLLVARMVLSFTGRGYGKFYDLVFEWSEKILAPVRRFTPRFGMFDLSPLVVIIGLNILKSVVVALLTSVEREDPTFFVLYIFGSIASIFLTIINIFIIVLILKVVLEQFSKNQSQLIFTLNRFTSVVTKRISKHLTFSQRRYLDYITIVVLIIISFIINKGLTYIYG